MYSATFDKLLVLLGPSLTFQDTRMRKVRATRRKVSSDSREKEHFCLLVGNQLEAQFLL